MKRICLAPVKQWIDGLITAVVLTAAVLVIAVTCVVAGSNHTGAISLQDRPIASASRPIKRPDWARDAACKIRYAGRPALELGEGAAVDCSDASTNTATVSCGGGGAEPLDISFQDLCRTKTLPLQRAESVRVSVADPSEVAEGTVRQQNILVTWMEFSGRLSPVAERVISAKEMMTVAVAVSPNRLLRFERRGFSPVTESSVRLADKKGWALPQPRAGGELLAWIESNVVSPVKLRLSGPDSREVDRNSQPWLSVQGLSEGSYRIARVYDGGQETAPIQAQVTAGASTVAVLRSEAVGGAEIGIDPELCRNTEQLRIVTDSKTLSPRGATTSSESVFTVQATGECSLRVGGIKPGNYRLSTMGTQALQQVVPFGAGVQRWTTVTISAPSVEIHGRVTFESAPLAYASIEFRGNSAQNLDSVSQLGATTNEFGEYSLRLPSAGSYSAALRRDALPLPGLFQTLLVRDGANEFNWNVDGGSISVRLNNWDGRSPVSVTLTPVSSAPGSASLSKSIRPDEDPAFSLRPVGLGNYRVTATSRTQVAREARIAIIDKDHLTASVELDLGANTSVLRIVDSLGNPISGVQFGGVAIKELSPGVYEQGNLAPGTRLPILKDGFAAACRRSTVDRDVNVTLEPGRTATLVMQGVKWGSLGGAVLDPDSDCPVDLSRLPSNLVVSSDDETTFLVRNFPTKTVPFFWQQTGERIPFQIRSDGVLQVKVPTVKK